MAKSTAPALHSTTWHGDGSVSRKSCSPGVFAHDKAVCQRQYRQPTSRKINLRKQLRGCLHLWPRARVLPVDRTRKPKCQQHPTMLTQFLGYKGRITGNALRCGKCKKMSSSDSCVFPCPPATGRVRNRFSVYVSSQPFKSSYEQRRRQ